MELKPLRQDTDYRAALAEADRLELLCLMIEDYEARHHAIDDPDPIEFLRHAIEARGLEPQDLEPILGVPTEEVLNRIRPLSLEMIRNLVSALNLPADVLIRRYPLRDAA